ncbi:MAG: DUF4314 domain-containing protein [Micavibrio sp.]|nr:DUF4314 domain-containing protein [Micavibrio sp.]
MQGDDAEETLSDFIELEICKDEVLFAGRSGGYLIFQEYDFFEGQIEKLQDYIDSKFTSDGEFESNYYSSFEQFLQSEGNDVAEAIGLIHYYQFAFGVLETYVKKLVKGIEKYAQEELEERISIYTYDNIVEKKYVAVRNTKGDSISKGKRYYAVDFYELDKNGEPEKYSYTDEQFNSEKEAQDRIEEFNKTGVFPKVESESPEEDEDAKLIEESIEGEYKTGGLVGKRIKIIYMNDKQAVEPDTMGTIVKVDGIGQYHVKWDNGRTLAVIPEEDKFEIMETKNIQTATPLELVKMLKNKETSKDAVAEIKRRNQDKKEMGGSIVSERRFSEADFNKLVDKSDLKGIWNGYVWEIVYKDGGGFIFGKFNPKTKTLFIAREKDLSNPLVKYLQQNSYVSAEEYEKLADGGKVLKNWDEFDNGGGVGEILEGVVTWSDNGRYGESYLKLNNNNEVLFVPRALGQIWFSDKIKYKVISEDGYEKPTGEMTRSGGGVYFSHRGKVIEIISINRKGVDVVFKKYDNGGSVENLTKELHKLQRDLNSSRLSTYREGDNSEEEIARTKEREVKLARFNEVLKLLNENDSKYDNGGDIYADGGNVRTLLKKFEDEKPSIALYVIAEMVAETFMRTEYDKNIVWEKLTDEQKSKYNQDYKTSKSDFEKHLVYSFVRLYYSKKKIKEKCKGQSKQTIANIKSVMTDIAKEYDTDKFPQVSPVTESESKREQPIQEVSKEIRTAPLKDVSDELISKAITEALFLPKFKNLTRDEADFIYKSFANYENQKNKLGEYVYEIQWKYKYGSNDDKAKSEDEKLKKFIEKMDKHGIITFSNYDGVIEADKAVIDFINSVRGRVYAIKGKSVSAEIPKIDTEPIALTEIEAKRKVLMTLIHFYTKATDKEKKESLWSKVQDVKQQIKDMENKEFKDGGNVVFTKSDMLRKLHALSKHKETSKPINDKYNVLNNVFKLKTGKDFENVLRGGKADGMDEVALAKKHGVSVATIRKQIEKGVEVEREHIDNYTIQREIALDHIEEFVDYYDRLAKMEKQAKVKHTIQALKGLSKSQINSIGNYMNNKGFDSSEFDVYDNGTILIYKDVDSRVYKEISMFIKNNVI